MQKYKTDVKTVVRWPNIRISKGTLDRCASLTRSDYHSVYEAQGRIYTLRPVAKQDVSYTITAAVSGSTAPGDYRGNIMQVFKEADPTVMKPKRSQEIRNGNIPDE